METLSGKTYSIEPFQCTSNQVAKRQLRFKFCKDVDKHFLISKMKKLSTRGHLHDELISRHIILKRLLSGYYRAHISPVITADNYLDVKVVMLKRSESLI